MGLSTYIQKQLAIQRDPGPRLQGFNLVTWAKCLVQGRDAKQKSHKQQGPGLTNGWVGQIGWAWAPAVQPKGDGTRFITAEEPLFGPLDEPGFALGLVRTFAQFNMNFETFSLYLKYN